MTDLGRYSELEQVTAIHSMAHNGHLGHPRRHRPPSLLPTSPPPNHAPPPPPDAQMSRNSGPSSLPASRSIFAHSLSQSASAIVAHPYSAHPYASSQDHDHQTSAEDVFGPAAYRNPHLPSSAFRPSHSPPPGHPGSANAMFQGIGLGISAQAASFDHPQPPPAATYQPDSGSPRRETTPGRPPPPGSYFAVYGQSARERVDSAMSSASTSTAPPRQLPSSSAPVSLPASTSTSTLPSSAQSQGPSEHLHPHRAASQHAPTSASSHSGHSRGQRPSSRRALTAALELAKAAVQLDATNDDPHGAVMAYAKSVQLLGEVMERVMRGEDSSGAGHAGAADGDERRRGGRRRSVVAKEEEVRRLKAIVSVSIHSHTPPLCVPRQCMLIQSIPFSPISTIPMRTG